MEIMKSNNQNTDEFLEKGLDQIKADLRTYPDALLWERVADESISGPEIKRRKHRIKQPVIKLTWSAVAAAAALYVGIVAGNAYRNDNIKSEKVIYQNELADSQSIYSPSSGNKLLIDYISEGNMP